MRQKVSLLLLVCILTSVLFHYPVPAVAASQKEELVTKHTETYREGNKYSGATIAPHFNVDDFADLIFVDSGGTHVDGSGKQVYSNYIMFDLKLNFNPNTKKIAGTDVKVSKDVCDWNDTPYAQKGETEHPIAYGAIYVTRTDGYGGMFQYSPIFSTGNTHVSNLFFNEDGDYTIHVLFETVKKNVRQNHILSWSFKVRSSIFVNDKETGCAIKNSHISNRDAVVDYANRTGVELECEKNGSSIRVYDGYIMSADYAAQDKYSFTVKNKGFICEKFDFHIDAKNPCEKIYFANLRKQLGPISYEAEEWFYLTWEEYPNNPITVVCEYYDYETEKPIKTNYVKNKILEGLGLYHITVNMRTVKVEYWIEVVEADAPSHNYNALSAKRFNTFKTKWYEVCDDTFIQNEQGETTGENHKRYLCFDVSEYDRAYNAAMTVENSSVVESGSAYVYNGIEYADRIDLTAAMNDYVFGYNLNIRYYDPEQYSLSTDSERVFSSSAFDSVLYLDDAFQFVSSHSSETNSVVATDENGKQYSLQFFVPIAEQDLPDGKYTIDETDAYGNKTTYRVFRDKSAPSVKLRDAEAAVISVEKNGSYQVDEAFSVESFLDAFDEYAVLKIVKPSGEICYYYKEEYEGIVFQQKGAYAIKAYDRNQNTVSFVVNVN